MPSSRTHQTNPECDKRISKVEQTLYGDGKSVCLIDTVNENTEMLKKVLNNFQYIAVGWSLISGGLAVYALFFSPH